MSKLIIYAGDEWFSETFDPKTRVDAVEKKFREIMEKGATYVDENGNQDYYPPHTIRKIRLEHD